MTTTTTAAVPHIGRTSDKALRTKAAHGLLAETVMAKFPARPPASALDEKLSVDKAVDRADEPQFRASCESTRFRRRRGTEALLGWLANFPGDIWQQRWQASGAETEQKNWTAAPLESLAAQDSKVRRDELCSGVIMLALTRVIHPSPAFLLTMTRSRHWVTAVGDYRDPSGFAFLRATVDAGIWESRNGFLARWQIAIIILAKGGGVRDITVCDCLELRQLDIIMGLRDQPRYLFYALLHSAGIFPPGAPATLRAITTFAGQYSIERLIDRYQLANPEIRDLLVNYLAERQAALDYSSLEDLARTLGLHFWKNLETHHPGIDSLHLAPDVARAWKERLRTRIQRKRLADGSVVEVTVPRVSYFQLATVIRAFYLDIAQWAIEDPARWGRWAAPSPISGSEVNYRKILSRRKARMDQRTRDRLPLLPALVQTAERRAEEARTRLDAALAAAPHQTFTVLGETFTRTSVTGRLQGHKAGRRGMGVVTDSSGRRRKLRAEENRAFWAWAAVEFLRHTGARIEEMLETSHHSITQYRHPESGQVIPLLHIAPSKTDEERLLVISPELADVLSTIITRVRQTDGTIPSVPFYDTAERVWAAPAPLLFQWNSAGHDRAIAGSTIRKGIKEIFEATDLKDAEGEPLYFQPHDLRRVFATDAILNGMPPHIAQMLLGHKDISTTMGYKAVYPQEAINGHRAFITRRRALRPSEEYRTPTDAEWDEFLGHFERRKIALGECGRAYGTTCQHEHSCIRCPVLRVDPAQRRRLEQIRDNLTLRIDEAEREGWLGEAEGLRVSLAAANEKLAQLDERARRAATVFLNIPAFPEVVGGTIAGPELKTCRK